VGNSPLATQSCNKKFPQLRIYSNWHKT
jgi:hypothetical protein